MDKHGIDISVVRYAIRQWHNMTSFKSIICTDNYVSTANPWLDFLSAPEATEMATNLNTDLEEYCSTAPSPAGSPTLRRLYGMALLPIVPGVAVLAVLEEIERVAKLPHLRGIVLGTQGLGKGLDDGELPQHLLILW